MTCLTVQVTQRIRAMAVTNESRHNQARNCLLYNLTNRLQQIMATALVKDSYSHQIKAMPSLRKVLIVGKSNMPSKILTMTPKQISS